VTVPAGSRVTFVNNHTASHEMTSDPHPDHTICPPLNQVGNLSPGQSRTSGNLNTVRVCTYHDHLNDGNENLQGTIRVQ
jgi:plastocyanin